MTLQPLPSGFPYTVYEEFFLYLFISAAVSIIFQTFDKKSEVKPSLNHILQRLFRIPPKPDSNIVKICQNQKGVAIAVFCTD
jgi:hypothetical protein